MAASLPARRPEAVPGSFSRSTLRLRCPSCFAGGASLQDLGTGAGTCPSCGFRMEVRDGIIRALPQDSRKRYQRFIEEYSAIRRAEGRGSEDPSYYLGLPYRDLTGKHSEQWFIRGRSYRYFERRILPPLEKEKSLVILDLGAGNGWMSYRLALR